MEKINIPFQLIISTINDDLFDLMEKLDLSKCKYFKDGEKCVTLDQFIESFYYDNIKLKEMILDGNSQEITLQRKKLSDDFLDRARTAFKTQYDIQTKIQFQK